MTDIELFAGGGGLAVGLNQAGFTNARFYEKDPWSAATLRFNTTSRAATLSGTVIQADVTHLKWGLLPVDGVRLLSAGAPCQPFSLGGKHRADADGRNLFPDVFRAIRALRPRAIVLENVRGLLRRDFRPYFEYVLRQLEVPFVAPRPSELWHHHDARVRQHQCSRGYEPAYHVSWRLLEAADYGVPQTRQRVIMVGTRADLPVYRFPRATHSKSALFASQLSGAYWDKLGLRRPAKVQPLSPSGDSQTLLPWVTVREALCDLPTAAKHESGSEMNHWSIPGARVYAGHTGAVLDWPSKTIKAGVHGVPGGENALVDDTGRVRYFTLRELARLQTFPDHHFFAGARIHVTRQIGNAVPCVLAEVVGRPLLQLLRSEDQP